MTYRLKWVEYDQSRGTNERDEMNTTPNLTARLADHTIVNIGEWYVGRCADGVEVLLGPVGDEARIERYLADYPTPNHW